VSNAPPVPEDRDRTTDGAYYAGVALVCVAALIYSTAGLFIKGVEAGSWQVIFWRGLFSLAFTTAWAGQRGNLRREFLGMGPAGLAVGLIGALGSAAFVPAFKLTSIANVALIYAAAPLLAAMIAWLTIRERASTRTLAGCLGAMAGVAVIVSGSLGGISLHGDLLALCMTMAMATIMVLYRRYPRTPGAGPAALQSIFLVPVALLFADPFALPTREILVLAGFGLLFAISSVALAEGAKRVPSGQAALLSALETPLAPLLSFLAFSEVPSLATALGGGIVLAAVLGSIQARR